MRIILAFDIDDVITKTSERLLKGVEMYGEGIDFNNLDTSKQAIMRGKAATPAVKAFFEKYGTDICKGVELKEDADKVISNLKRRGAEIHLITARDESLMPGITKATIDYFADKEIPYDQIHIGVHNKKELCEKLGVKCLTDDSMDTCRSLLETSIKPILFTTDVNKEFDAKGMQRVADWNELSNVLMELLEKEVGCQCDER